MISKFVLAKATARVMSVFQIRNHLNSPSIQVIKLLVHRKKLNFEPLAIFRYYSIILCTWFKTGPANFIFRLLNMVFLPDLLLQNY